MAKYLRPVSDKGENLGHADYRYNEGHIFELHADKLGQTLSLNGQTITGNATFSGNLTFSGDLVLSGSSNTITGIIQTSDSGQRLVISGPDNNMKFYDADGKNVLTIDDDENAFVKCELESYTFSKNRRMFYALASNLSGGGAYTLQGMQVNFNVDEQSLLSIDGVVVYLEGQASDFIAGLRITGVINKGNTPAGPVYGLYIADNLSTTGAGSVYPIYSLATELSLFSGDVAIAAAKKLVLDGETGNVHLVWNNGDSRLEFYIGGNLAGYVNEATGFVNV